MHARTASAAEFDILDGSFMGRSTMFERADAVPPGEPGTLDIGDAAVVRLTFFASVASAASAVAGLALALTAG